MPATLESRFPQIIAELGPRVDLTAHEGALLIAARAKAKVPPSISYSPETTDPSGRLRDSIHVEEEGNDYYVVADAEDDYGYPYAFAVEFGGHKLGAGAGPHAFMIPALEETKAQIIGAAKLAIQRL